MGLNSQRICYIRHDSKIYVQVAYKPIQATYTCWKIHAMSLPT